MKDRKNCTKIQLMQVNTQLGLDWKAITIAVKGIIIMVTTVLYQVAFRHYSNFYNSFTNNNNNTEFRKDKSFNMSYRE